LTEEMKEGETGISSDLSSSLSERRLFYFFVVVLTLACLFPVWWLSLLPMQDFPQHLQVSRVISTWGSPQYDWQNYYILHIKPQPYILHFLLMAWLAKLFGIMTAGRIIVSLITILTTALVLVVARREKSPGNAPWGVLLLYPLVFNQMFYLGFINYCLSVPLVFLAIKEHSAVIRSGSKGASFRLLIYLTTLFFLHPYPVLVYVVLALIQSTLYFGDGKRFVRAVVPPLALGIVFTAWYFVSYSGMAGLSSIPWAIRWWPTLDVARFLALQFTGMLEFSLPGMITLALWLAAITLLTLVALRSRRLVSVQRGYVRLVLVCLAGYFALPFWYGHNSYFNLRLAPFIYVFLVLLSTGLPVSRRTGTAVAAIALSLVAVSIDTQKRVSSETGEIIPVARSVGGNARVLPIVADGSSHVLPEAYFYQMHLHDPTYVHVLEGGGINGELLDQALFPVRYMRPLDFPALPQGNPVELLASVCAGPRDNIDYIVYRGPALSASDVKGRCEIVVVSGSWTLLKPTEKNPPQG
jgi:hypothetical protein